MSQFTSSSHHSQARRCPGCGFTLPADKQFCTLCGASLATVATGFYDTRLGGGAPPHVMPGRAHSPALALIFGLLIPGAGQAYNGQPVKGFFILFLSGLILPWIYSIFDAYFRAKKIQSFGGRMGKGGFFWVFLQFWLWCNVVLLAVIFLSMYGRLQ